MTVGNLGVCFGPTLLRPKEETMAAIMDIKFCNVVVEVLIAHCEQIFGTEPPKSIGQPCPPKPDHRSIHQESSHPVISLSVSATSSVPTSTPVRPRAFVPSPPAIRAHAAAGSATGNLASTNSHIYDVPPEAASSSKLLPTYGAASSSAATTPTTPPSQSASVLSTRTPGTAAASSSSRAAAHCESSDSLNSLISGGSDSPKASASSKVSVESRGKVSTSYAPAYNPLACETRRSSSRPVGVPSTSTSTISVPNNSSTTSSSECPVQRISPMYSSMINPVVSLQPRTCETLYACTPDHESELSFQPGQIITNVYESKEEGWLVGTLNGKTGLIPCNYVEPLP
ncbi:SH3 domain protein, partial [Ostertagia ostertagi]